MLAWSSLRRRLAAEVLEEPLMLPSPPPHPFTTTSPLHPVTTLQEGPTLCFRK